MQSFAKCVIFLIYNKLIEELIINKMRKITHLFIMILSVGLSAFIATEFCYYFVDWFAALLCTIPFAIVDIAVVKTLLKTKKFRFNSALKSTIYILSVLLLILVYGCFLICLNVYFKPWDIIRYILAWFVIASACIIFKQKVQTYFNSKKEEKNIEKKRQLLKYYNYCRSKDEFVDSLLIDYGERPTEFEKFVADLMTAAEYKNVKVTPAVNDGGKDITAVKDNNFYVVEVKLYNKDNKIGREKIQKLHSAMIDSNADKAIFVTTSDFTLNAVEYAEKYNIQTINGEDLYKIYLDIKSE